MHFIALGVVSAACLAASITIKNPATNHELNECRKNVHYKNTYTQPTENQCIERSPTGKFPGKKDYKEPCHNAKSGPNSDLCQQWRMAEATESLVELTRPQVVAAITAAFMAIFGAVVATIAAFWAKEAAQHTKRAADIADRTSKQELRAYVCATFPRETKGSVQKGTFNTRIKIRNVGQTPAFKIQSKTIARVLDVSVERTDAFPPIVHSGDKTKSIFPNIEDSINVRMPDVITEDQIVEMELGRKNIYVWGAIKYEDVFGAEHVTRYAFFTSVKSGDYHRLFDGEQIAIRWSAAAVHNDAD